MTTLLDDGSEAPRTHLFVVGVGAYRHLPGGSEPLDHLRGVRLSQLASPPLSARAVADWFLREMRNPDAPLGSAELLLSPADAYRMPDGSTVDVEGGTIDNIAAAFDRWLARCDRSEDNIAIWYLCGHGVMREVVALLAEDFGRSPHRPYEAAVDFTMTFEGLAKSKARRQLYLVDACREVMRSSLALQRIDATPLAVGTFERASHRDAPVLFASAEDDRAYARVGEPTRLADALIRCLSGLASERVDRRWVVTTRKLLEGTAEIIARENTPDAPMQRPRPGGEPTGLAVPLHRPAGPPRVATTIDCLPEQAVGLAELSLVSVRDAARAYARPPAPGRWAIEVEPGDYDVSATFRSGEYRDRKDELLALPPFTDHSLEV